MPKILLYVAARISELSSLFKKGPPHISMTKYRGLTSSIWHLDSSKIEQELGFQPIVSLEEGARRTISFYGWDTEEKSGEVG